MKWILVLSLLVVSCTSQVHPVPEKAVKMCLDKDWEVTYMSKSNASGTTFKCLKPKRKGR